MEGGYSIRKMKKFMNRERKRLQQEKDDKKKNYDAKRAQAAGEVVLGEEDLNEADAVADAPYSDESDIDEILNVIDDETFEKYVEDAKKQDF